MDSANIHVRCIEEEELFILKEMSYEAIFLPPGEDPPPRSILDTPELSKYYRNWGRPGDIALVADHHRYGLIGACWIRLHRRKNPGYGFIDDFIPELTVAIKSDFRNQGLGTQLIRRLIQKAHVEGFRQISLSVDPRNPAIHLYKRIGFRVVKIDSSNVMLYDQNKKKTPGQH